MVDTNLTTLQAFNAMRKFLEDYYARTASDEVGALLGDLQLFPEGGTFDPAAWDDWMKSVAAVLKDKQGS